MARLAEANETYAVAESFRGRCLAGGRSLLWPDAPAWTTENLDRLWTAFVQHPDESKDKSFLEKWQGQLSEEPDDVCRIAADLLVLYHLINSGTKPETKSAEIHRLVSCGSLSRRQSFRPSRVPSGTGSQMPAFTTSCTRTT